MRIAATLAALLLALPAAAQDAGASAGASGAAPDARDDCTFLQHSFAGVYEGQRQMAGGDVEEADPATATMFAAIQANIILLADAADCDMGPMIETAREQLARYAPQAVE